MCLYLNVTRLLAIVSSVLDPVGSGIFVRIGSKLRLRSVVFESDYFSLSIVGSGAESGNVLIVRSGAESGFYPDPVNRSGPDPSRMKRTKYWSEFNTLQWPNAVTTCN